MFSTLVYVKSLQELSSSIHVLTKHGPMIAFEVKKNTSDCSGQGRKSNAAPVIGRPKHGETSFVVQCSCFAVHFKKRIKDFL